MSLLFVASCGHGGGAVLSDSTVSAAPRIESARTRGEADGLAAELLLTGARVPLLPLRSGPAVPEIRLAKSLANAALDHVRSVGLGQGAGADLLGSRRLRRLAAAGGAPPDSNGDGSNLDETLQQELARALAFAGGDVPSGLRTSFLPWRESSADLAGDVGPFLELDLAKWRTAQVAPAQFRLADVGDALRARLFAARALLALSRGELRGGTARDGTQGLVLVLEALAAEEELLRALSTDGLVLSAFADPATYDPRNGARWWPAELEAVEVRGVVEGYRVRDAASDLEGLASVLEAAADLAWLASDEAPPSMRAVFRDVFPPGDGTPPPPPTPSWNGGLRDLFWSRCGDCHLGFPTGGFLVDTLPLVLQGGVRSRAAGLTMIVPGNHRASFLYTMLEGPPPPYLRMPPTVPFGAADMALVAEWIDRGALLDAPSTPSPARPGVELARVAFANLVALHFDPGSGALNHRFEGDLASGFATASATGRALQALCVLAVAQPALRFEGRSPFAVLAAAASFARAQMVGPNGEVWAEVTHGSGPFRTADLRDHATLTAGLLDAARLTGDPAVEAVALRALDRLLTSLFDVENGWFVDEPFATSARYTPTTVRAVLAALRAGAAALDDRAAPIRDRFAARLRAAMIHAAYLTNDEMPADGVRDTNGDGIPEPALAGGLYGRLPLLAASILVGRGEPTIDASTPITWSQHVRPLLQSKCAACHFGGNAEGGYRCDTPLRLASPAQSEWGRPLVVPGSAADSLFFQKLALRVPAVGERMPLQQPPLDARGLELVRRWIDGGASLR